MGAWQTSDPIRIVIPGPPRALERNRHRIVTPRGRPSFVTSYLPTASRNEQSAMRLFASQAMGKHPPMDGPIDLRFVAYLPVPASWSKKKQAAALSDQIRPTGRPDLDNLMKMVDAFKEIVWRDDAQVTDAAVWKRYSETPRLVIEVRMLVAG